MPRILFPKTSTDEKRSHDASAGIIALLAACALLACSDDKQPEPSQPDAAPSGAPVCEPDKLDLVQNVIYYNGLDTSKVMFNALLTNREALASLIDSPLRSETYDQLDHPGTANATLSEQLGDPWSQRAFSSLVACALPRSYSVIWSHDKTGQKQSFAGERGFCPAWQDQSLSSMESADRNICQELVSACVLASNNAFGSTVRISMRGMQNDVPLPWNDAVPSGTPDDVQSWLPCDGSSSVDPDARDCGWDPGHVGTCEPEKPISLTPSDSCEPGSALRVCTGADACDHRDALGSLPDMCSADPMNLECPAEGKIALMTTPRSSPATPPVVASNARYPVAESELYTWREGAFFGNLLDPGAIDPRIEVRIENGEVIYAFSPDRDGDRKDESIYDVACNDLSSDPDDLRDERHSKFLDRLAETYPGEDIIVHSNLHACWDPGWTAGAAYAAQRVCAGPGARKFCVAEAVGTCWNKQGADDNRCLTEDSHIDADETSGAESGDRLGDRDYDSCEDGHGRSWENPITVFLDSPCAFPGSPCGTRRPISVSGNNSHTCVALSSGEVRCWGRGAEGQLGHGNTLTLGDDETPAAGGDVDIGAVVDQVATGSAHTCVLLGGPDDTGRVKCWGANSSGQLGYGDTTPVGDDESPKVRGTIDIPGVITQLVAGANHTCALVQGGDVWCWGLGSSGQLGYGNTLAVGDDEVPSVAGAVAVGGTVTSIAAGDFHTCALLDDATVKCWGSNTHGQLGVATTLAIGDDETPELQSVIDVGGPVVEIVAGADHTCARLQDGAIRCWGRNHHGQLGTLGYIGHPDPIGDDETPATAGPVDVGGTVTRLSAGGDFTCALLDTARVRCWGRNDRGQLGYGHIATIGDDEAPATAGDVPVGFKVMGLAQGSNHMCVTGEASNVRCWGRNQFSQLGYSRFPDTVITTDNIGDDEVPADIGNVPVF